MSMSEATLKPQIEGEMVAAKCRKERDGSVGGSGLTGCLDSLSFPTDTSLPPPRLTG